MKAPKKSTRDKRRPKRATAQPRSFPVVGVGASAGGLEAYLELFGQLPPNTGMAFVLVQHLAPTHVSQLAEIVKKKTAMSVREAEDGLAIAPDTIYVIPPNRVLEIEQGRLRMKKLPERQATNRLVDIFFASLARDHGTLAVGVVLSGTGSDGSQGLREIKAEGGFSLVQDPKTARHDGMPRNAIALDHPDFVLPIKGLAEQLVKFGSHPAGDRLTRSPPLSRGDEDALHKIFHLLRHSHGTDFSAYKLPTIVRRVNRRMVLQRCDSLAAYLGKLRANPGEAKALFDDLLINVTSFFRDRETFEVLSAKVLPALVRDRDEKSTVRVWVPGCATGEEVYSLAILALEYFAKTKKAFPLQIYGTDISEATIKKARAGTYAASIERSIPPEWLGKYFVKEGDSYRVAREVRDCCVFSIQDVTTDPPIHRLDLLSCRNLMIYLGPDAQKKLMHTFYYALNPLGFLLLGSAETTGAGTGLFSQADQRHKIFQKRVAIHPPGHGAALPAPKSVLAALPSVGVDRKKDSGDPLREAERFVEQHYSPSWLLLNQALEVVQIRGRTESFLVPASGQPSWNLARVLREELVPPVRLLIHRATKSRGSVRKEGLPFRAGRSRREVNVEVKALRNAGGSPHFLVVFAERAASPAAGKAGPEGGRGKELQALRRELKEAQTSLREVLDWQTSSNEVFQNASEDMLSANEELQSTNEELETAKEELQSTNEELTTLNDELRVRNHELANASNDLINVLNNTDIPLVLLGPELELRRYTPAAARLLNLMPRDLGRTLLDIKTGFDDRALEEGLREVKDTSAGLDLKLPGREGRRHSVRIRPYRTIDNKIDGLILVFSGEDKKPPKERS